MEENISRKRKIPGYLHLYIVTLCVPPRAHKRATSALEYAIRRVEENKLVFELNGKHQLPVYARKLGVPIEIFKMFSNTPATNCIFTV